MTQKAYTAESIKSLDIIEAIRSCIGMYISGADDDGVEVIAREVIDNSIDEFMNGHGSKIIVSIDSKRAEMSVLDYGRGIPPDPYPQDKSISTLQAVLTCGHTGGKFSSEYGITGGLHGTGLKAMTALSKYVTAKVWRGDGYEYTLNLADAKPTKPIQKEALGRDFNKKQTGTFITFAVDPKYLVDATSMVVSFERMDRLLKERAYLNPGLTIQLVYDGKVHTYAEKDGIAAYVKELSNDKGIAKIIHMSTGTDTADKIQAELALCWTSLNGRDITTGYCNSIRQTEGGTHVQGVRMSVPGVIRSYIQNNELLTKKDKDVTIESNDCFEGVYAIVSVKHMSPIFKGQHKGKLSNTDVQGSVQRLVNAKLAQWLEENPKDARNIANRVISAARARIAASKAKDQVRKQDAGSFGMNNFGKLKDCASTDITENELFIVEGDSAGGSASNGRNRLTQAIYSLRGKPLNSWELETSRVLSNNELSDLACAVGTGLFTDLQTDEEIEAAYSKIRYGKVVVLADADIDGCGRSDTLIATTSGPKTFKDLIDSDIIYKGYARNENGKIVIVDLHNPRITKYVTKLLKITLDNGREEFFTEDHPFRLKDGSYVEARCLTPDMDLDDVCLQTIDEKL